MYFRIKSSIVFQRLSEKKIVVYSSSNPTFRQSLSIWSISRKIGNHTVTLCIRAFRPDISSLVIFPCLLYPLHGELVSRPISRLCSSFFRYFFLLWISVFRALCVILQPRWGQLPHGDRCCFIPEQNDQYDVIRPVKREIYYRF